MSKKEKKTARTSFNDIVETFIFVHRMQDTLHSCLSEAERATEHALWCKGIYVSPKLIRPVRNTDSNGYHDITLDEVPLQIRKYSKRISADYVKKEFAGRIMNERIDKDILNNIIKALNDLLIAEEQFSPIMRQFSDEYEAISRLWLEMEKFELSPWAILVRLVTGDYKWNTRLVEEAAVVELWKGTGVNGRRSLADDPVAVKLRKACRRVERAVVVYSLSYNGDIQEKEKNSR